MYQLQSSLSNNNNTLILQLIHRKTQLEIYRCVINTCQFIEPINLLFTDLQALHSYIQQQDSTWTIDQLQRQLIIQLPLQQIHSDKYLYFSLQSISQQQYSDTIEELFNSQIQSEQQIMSQGQKHEAQYKSILLELKKEESQDKEIAQFLEKDRLYLIDQFPKIDREVRKLKRIIASHDDQIQKATESSSNFQIKNQQVQSQEEKERKTIRREIFLEHLKNKKQEKYEQISSMEEYFLKESLELCDFNLQNMKSLNLFTNLTSINLSKNNLEKIDTLDRFIFLEKLDLSRNHIARIENLKRNLQLKELILHTNKICKIESLFNLKNLQLLSLSNNRIEEIADTIENLQNLKELRVINNRIRFISVRMTYMKHLKIFSIRNICFSERHKCKDLINKIVANDVSTACLTF